MNEHLYWVRLVASRLESARISYMLNVQLATAVHALSGMARDIDLVVDCKAGDSKKVCESLVADCYVDEAQVHGAIAWRAEQGGSELGRRDSRAIGLALERRA